MKKSAHSLGHWFKIGSFALALHTRNLAISTKSGEKQLSLRLLRFMHSIIKNVVQA